MRYLIALLLVSTSAFAGPRYLSDGNGGYYVYNDQQSNFGQQLSNFGNRGGLLSRMEQNRQIQLENQLLEQQILLQQELMRRQLGQ